MILDLVCVLVLDWGVKGAAVATVFSQYVSGVGIGLYTLKKVPAALPETDRLQVGPEEPWPIS